MDRQPAAQGQPSLQRTLLLWLLPALVLLVPLGALLIYRIALIPALDALDHALTDTTAALERLIERKGEEVSLPISPQTAKALLANLNDEMAFAVVGPDGHLLGGSAALGALAQPMAPGQWAFRDAELAGHAVRVAMHAVPCGENAARVCTVLVSETRARRTAARNAALLGAVLGALALALPLAGLAVLAVRRALRPVASAAREVAQLTPESLRAVATDGVPREVLGFVHATNQLLDRLHHAATAQRNFVSDAAHQLRTPLAIMRVEAAELLTKPHPDALHAALERLHGGAERGSRLAEQLLALARVEGAGIDPARPTERVDLAALIAERADRWVPSALQAGQDLGFDLRPASLRGDPVLLGELARNLVQNAVAYAEPGARITVSTASDRLGVELVVEDDGPGVPVSERAALGQRFHRGRHAPGSGSGLGLAIVTDIARLHGAVVRFEEGDGGRGLRVRVRFGPIP